MRISASSVAATLLLLSPSAFADAFDEYAGNTSYTFDLPTVTDGWSVALDGFPTTAQQQDVEGYALDGRLLVANDQTLYLQKNYGSSVFVPVATVSDGPMDPSFLAISPDGSTIALGVGYGAPLLVFPSSILSISSPPDLLNNGHVIELNVDYYDGAWYGDDALVINGGYSGPGGYTSGVYALDLTASPIVEIPLITSIPGASGGIAVDSGGNLVTGIGYQTSPNRTGELRIWAADDIQDAIDGTAGPYAYGGGEGTLLASNVLNAAALGFDEDDSLHVGGGDAFGVGGASENGYAALIRGSVVAGVLAGNHAAVNEASSSQYRTLAPDPCQDDSATAPIAFVGHTSALAIAWNPSGDEYSSPAGQCYSAGSAWDYWEVGVTPKVTLYFPDGAPDSDSDGVPDGADNAYLTANADQRDTDGDGFGNIADADLDNDGDVDTNDYTLLSAAMNTQLGNPGYNQHADFNGDGYVNTADDNIYLARNSTSAPFY
ncbi:dockerin type I domain-containing protein [Sorangium sp. So ce1000]|uniref:dockerin type I domain-containing protein n=1 Tax=Sorangium sp. So ce1000 TaxID=3133325 RepID=UPI003F5F6085